MEALVAIVALLNLRGEGDKEERRSKENGARSRYQDRFIPSLMPFIVGVAKLKSPASGSASMRTRGRGGRRRTPYLNMESHAEHTAT